MEDYVKEAVEVCSEESFGESYDKEVALQEQARNDGYEKGIEDVALSMLKDNVDINTIAKYTDLSIEEINDLNTD